MNTREGRAAVVWWFCGCRAWATVKALPWRVTGANGLAWLSENSGVQLRGGLLSGLVGDCPMTIWLGSGERMQRNVLWRYASRVDFVRVKLVCKVLWQKHVLRKGQSQRTPVVWGRQTLIKKLSEPF